MLATKSSDRDENSNRTADISRVLHPLGALHVERRRDGRRRLLRRLRVDVSKLQDESVVAEVPSRFVTDYSSIPWYGRFLVRWSKVDVAGVVDDYLYRTDAVLNEHGEEICLDNTIDAPRRADAIWSMVARTADRSTNRVQAWVGFRALLVGAKAHFHQHPVNWPFPKEK